MINPYAKNCKISNRGFTLLELLIVIGILAILAAVTVLVINPAQLLKRARDSQRMSDLATLQTAIGLYMTDYTNPTIGTTNKCYFSLGTGLCAAAACAGGVNCTNSQAVDSTGWVPINFNNVSGGSPLGSLPIDPTNTSNTTAAAHLYYLYKANDTTLSYEINANLESDMYKYAGTQDKESKDGGDSLGTYEVGNTTTLIVGTSSGIFGD